VEIPVQADMLKCTKCTKTCGAQIESSIAFSSCGSSAFGNNGGKLVCEDLPPGPYLRSCNNCNKVGLQPFARACM